MSPVDQIDVDPERFRAASRALGDVVHGQLVTTVRTLENALSQSGAMAGSDPVGTAWAATYDPAAREVHGVMADLPAAVLKVAAMLFESGANHDRANGASDPTAGTPTPADTNPYDTDAASSPVDLPSASGGSGSPPTGWGLIQSAVGYAWPNGDPAKLRAAARAWSAAADGLEKTLSQIPETISEICTQKSAEVSDALTVCQGLTDSVWETTAACRGLAKACSDLADAIEKAHQEIEDELVSLVEWTVAIELAGAAAGAFSAGAGEGAAQAAEAARIAATARRVAQFIKAVVEVAGTAGRAVGDVVRKIGPIAQRLKRILSVRVTKTTVEAAKKVPEAAKDAEKLAEELAAREKHYRDLGMDPATGKYRPGESETASRIERERGVQLTRSKNPKGPDWTGPDGKTYDAVGNFDAKHFDQQWPRLQERIVDHLGKADYVPVDVSKFTPEQIAKIKEFIGPLGPRVFTVGE